MSIDDLLKEASLEHPVARRWIAIASPTTSNVVFERRAGSAELVLEIHDDEGKVRDYKKEDWDADLHDALVSARFKAPDLENEAERFGYALHGKFERIGARYGNGFFSSVFLKTIRDLGLDAEPAIKELLIYIHQSEPYAGGNALHDCAELIRVAIGATAKEIQSLGYDADQTKTVLVGSLALYVDDRFSVTPRRRSAWQ